MPPGDEPDHQSDTCHANQNVKISYWKHFDVDGMHDQFRTGARWDRKIPILRQPLKHNRKNRRHRQSARDRNDNNPSEIESEPSSVHTSTSLFDKDPNDALLRLINAIIVHGAPARHKTLRRRFVG